MKEVIIYKDDAKLINGVVDVNDVLALVFIDEETGEIKSVIQNGLTCKVDGIELEKGEQ